MRRFDPAPHLHLAEELATLGDQGEQPTEIKLRTAVGRAYYGILLLAREITGVTDDEAVHATVI